MPTPAAPQISTEPEDFTSTALCEFISKSENAIANAEAELASREALPPCARLALELHHKLCTRSHTGYGSCPWKQEDWDGAGRAYWVKAAKELLEDFSEQDSLYVVNILIRNQVFKGRV